MGSQYRYLPVVAQQRACRKCKLRVPFVALMPRHAPGAGQSSTKSKCPEAWWVGDGNHRLCNNASITYGHPSKSYVDPQLAYGKLVRSQRASCTPRVKLALVRMSTFGIANDLNNAVKSLHMAQFRDSQLILLPPDRAELAKVNLSTADVARPWHWLPDRPVSDILSLSACHKYLLKHNRTWLQKVADQGPTAELQAAVPFNVRVLGFKWRIGAFLSQIPVEFRAQGLLWWWSVLSTYLVRPRGKLAAQVAYAIGQHPSLGSVAPSPESLLDFRNSSAPYLFDLGLHVRMGDACGPNAAPQAGRRCITTLRQALLRARSSTTTRRCSTGQRRGAATAQRCSDAAHSLRADSIVYLASDSDSIVHDVGSLNGAPDLPAMRVYHLDINRSKYDSRTRIEERNHSGTRRMQILTETLLEVAFLSRAQRLAGAMLGNLPRLAMQLRVRSQYDYVSLDGRAWCTKTACKMDSYEKYGNI